MSPVHVDTRWDGAHGIGRYSREVLARLTVPWQGMALDGSPTAPLDALRRLPAGAAGLVYSPGYNAFLRSGQQVLTMHDLIQLHAPWAGRAKYLAYYAAAVRPVVRRSGVVITVSETSRVAIAEWLRDDRVEVVNAGIGCSEAFQPDVAPAPATEPYLMYVGNLRAHKNVPVVLDALARLPRGHLRLLLPRGEQEAARSLARHYGVADRVTLLSGLDDEELASHYRGAAATVMPSLLEGFGLPALESLMTGTPVIHWRGCAAVAETVGDSGWAVDAADDPRGWSEALETALGDERRVVPPVGRYSWDQTARIVTETLKAHAA